MDKLPEWAEKLLILIEEEEKKGGRSDRPR